MKASIPFSISSGVRTTDSGGPGEYRGGMGATACWIPHDTEGRPIQLVLATFGGAFPTALGIDGGYPANTAMYKMLRSSDIAEWFQAGRDPRGICRSSRARWNTSPQKFEILEHESRCFRAYMERGRRLRRPD